jgi:hypothetical protein
MVFDLKLKVKKHNLNGEIMSKFGAWNV